MIDDARSGHSRGVSPVESVAELAPPEATVTFSPAHRNGVLRALVRDHFDFIWRSLRRVGLSPPDADDAAQRVFLIASQKLERIEGGRERAFLFGTAQRVAMETRRSGARRPETATDAIDVPDSRPGPEEAADRNQARALLDQVLDAMPMEARVPFVLFELEELTVPDIAGLLELPVGTVSSRLRRARELFHAAASRIRARDDFNGGLR